MDLGERNIRVNCVSPGGVPNGHNLVVDGGITGGRSWRQSQMEGRQLMEAIALAAAN